MLRPLFLTLAAVGAAAVASPVQAATLTGPPDNASFEYPALPTLTWALGPDEFVDQVFVREANGPTWLGCQDGCFGDQVSLELSSIAEEEGYRFDPGMYEWRIRTRLSADESGPTTLTGLQYFEIRPPLIRTLAASVKAERDDAGATDADGNSIPTGSTAFSLKATAFSTGAFRLTRHSRTLRRKALEFDPDGANYRFGTIELPKYSWSCARTGLHRWKVTATDDYDRRMTKTGTFTVPRCTRWVADPRNQVAAAEAAWVAAHSISENPILLKRVCLPYSGRRGRRAEVWGCAVAWFDGNLACTESFGIRFRKRVVFGKALQAVKANTVFRRRCNQNGRFNLIVPVRSGG